MSANKHYLLGMAKVKENDFDAAIELFTKAIKENSNDVDSYSERAVCYLHTKQTDLSMFDMNKAIELEPNHGYYYSCRAFLKSNIGDYEGCVADYQKAVELDPKDLVAYNNLGIAQENLGYYQKAQESFKKSNELLGYDPEKREIKGDIAVDKEDEKAIEVKEEKQENTPLITDETPIGNTDKTKPSKGRVMLDVFSKKNTFKEFIQFIGNGFKIKENDKSGKS